MIVVTPLLLLRLNTTYTTFANPFKPMFCVCNHKRVLAMQGHHTQQHGRTHHRAPVKHVFRVVQRPEQGPPFLSVCVCVCCVCCVCNSSPTRRTCHTCTHALHGYTASQLLHKTHALHSYTAHRHHTYTCARATHASTLSQTRKPFSVINIHDHKASNIKVKHQVVNIQFICVG